PDQLTVARQYERKLIYDLLGHEVMPDVPTDTPVQCFGHDVINPKDCALRCFSKGAGCVVTFRRRPCGGRNDAPGGGLVARLRCVGVCRGMGRHTGAVHWRGTGAVLAQIKPPRCGYRRGGLVSCSLPTGFCPCRTGAAWRHPMPPCRSWPSSPLVP